MRKFITPGWAILFLLFFHGYSSLAQIGEKFPIIDGTSLTDKDLKIPKDTRGKFTLIGMAYSKKSEDELKTWFEPVYQTFIHKSESGLFGSITGYDVNVYFIPMFTGIKKAAAGKAEKMMKKKVDPKLLPHILFYKGNLKTYKDALDFEQKDTPYFFVLDKEGKIIYGTSGAYTKKKIKEIEDLVYEF